MTSLHRIETIKHQINDNFMIQKRRKKLRIDLLLTLSSKSLYYILIISLYKVKVGTYFQITDLYKAGAPVRPKPGPAWFEYINLS